MASIRIHLPAALRERSSGARSVVVDAGTVPDALSALVNVHPDLARLLFREPGVLRPHVHVFMENEDAGGARQPRPLNDGDELRIVPSIAGG
jgi:molybdopterin converting factor small subunit